MFLPCYGARLTPSPAEVAAIAAPLTRLKVVAQLRIGLAQVNSTVGDLAGNSDKVVEWTMRAAEQGARIVVFPEMALTGYPVEDLALRKSFVGGLDRRAAAAGARIWPRRDWTASPWSSATWTVRPELAPRVGVPAGAPLDAAAVLHGGRVMITSAKHHLPNYGVFDEFRYFVPGDTLPVFRLAAEAGEPVDVAWRSARTCGRTVARWQSPGRPAPDCWWCRTRPPTSATRTTCGWRCASDARPRPAQCSPTPTWSAARTSWSSTVTRSSSPPSGELLARGPQFAEALVLADLDLPAADPGLPAGRQRVERR